MCLRTRVVSRPSPLYTSIASMWFVDMHKYSTGAHVGKGGGEGFTVYW